LDSDSINSEFFLIPAPGRSCG